MGTCNGTAGGRKKGVVRRAMTCAALLLLALIPSLLIHTVQARTLRASRLPVSYAGVNYYDPTDYFTHCPDFTWLRPSCYNNRRLADPPRRQLVSDLRFVSSHHFGSIQRIWVSLDELMRWNNRSGFRGFVPGALANVDDVLRIYHRFGIKVILVLYAYDGSGWRYQFHPQSLDGHHRLMRRGYLRATRIFIRHLAARRMDVATAPILELQTEPYYQLERYFNNPSRLGAFRSCAGSSQSNWGCVDRQIIHPWLSSLYRTARIASHRFLYTFSDTGRLFEDQSYWQRMYPQDIIDEHLYDNAPWRRASYYRQALHFRKPWLASEVGCASGNTGCTYSGTASAPVDRWWLRHLASDGSQAVLVECHVTLWHYPDGPNSQQPTSTGRALETTARSDG